MSSDKDRPCEVCGNIEFIAGVGASPLGPCSFNYCGICLRIGAEPKWIIEATVYGCDGIENINPKLSLTYYDKDSDSYKDFRTGEIIPIMTTEPVHSFTKRADVVAYLIEKKKVENE